MPHGAGLKKKFLNGGGGAHFGIAPGALVCDRLTAELGSTMLAIIVMPWT